MRAHTEPRFLLCASLSPFNLPWEEVERPLIYPATSTYHATGHINNERWPWNITNLCQCGCCKLLDKVLGSLRRARSVWLKTTLTYVPSWGKATTATSGSIIAIYVSHISSLHEKTKDQQSSCITYSYMKGVSWKFMKYTMCHHSVVLRVCVYSSVSHPIIFSHLISPFFSRGERDTVLPPCYWYSSLRTVP